MAEAGADEPANRDGEAAEVAPLQTRSQRRGVISRIWRWIFGVRNEDYEKKLQHLSKEESAVHARMKRRAHSLKKRCRNLIFFSVTFEVVAVAFAIIAIKSLDFTGSMKFFRTLPAILLPCLSYVVYSAVKSISRMLDRKDQKTLERLRAERKAKIDELKEITNYYTTHQLIQRYDLDPAVKAAAATVLASKLGADSGLKVHIGDEFAAHTETCTNSGIEQGQSVVLRHRKQPSTGGVTPPQVPDAFSNTVSGRQGYNAAAAPSTLVVEHHRRSGASDGGWIAKIAALLVGEDPSQCYALICGNCHRHNGLARKEDFPHITYYCPHCHALNTSKQTGDQDVPSKSLSPPETTGGIASKNSADVKNNEVENNQELTEKAAD